MTYDKSCALIRNMEAQGGRALKSSLAIIRTVMTPLEAAGIEFLNHGQPGVRLRKDEARSTISTGKWWELHLDPQRGWIDGDRQGDFGQVIRGGVRPPSAVITVREIGLGCVDVIWQGPDRNAIARALAEHPKLPSGKLAPQMLA